VACSGAISEEAGERAAGIFKELSGRAAESGASRITAVATNALRAASNRKVIKDLLEKRAGSRVDILSARGEAFLGFAGATSELPPGSRAIVCDPGGTSTEISWGKAPLASGWTSFPVGAHIRNATSWKMPGDSSLPVGRESHTIVFTGGTAVSLAVVWNRIRGMKHDENVPTEMSRKDLDIITGWLESKPPELRGLLPPERIRLLPAGAAVLREIAGSLDAEELTITARDLRWGVVLGGGTIERGYLADEQESPDSR